MPFILFVLCQKILSVPYKFGYVFVSLYFFVFGYVKPTRLNESDRVSSVRSFDSM